LTVLRKFTVAVLLIAGAMALWGCGGGGGGSDSGTGGGDPPPVGTVPNPPSNLAAQRSSLQVTYITLIWSASTSTDVAGYSIYRKTSNQTSFSKIATVGTTSFTDTTVDTAVVFDQIQYYVTAVNSLGESAASNTATVAATVPGGGGPPPPPSF